MTDSAAPIVGDETSADGWFVVRQIARATYCLVEALGDRHPRFGPITTNSYLLVGTERAALIDAGFGIGDMNAAVRDITPLPIDLCISHGHWDHYGSAAQFDSIAVGALDASAIATASSAQMQAMVDGVPGRCVRETPAGFAFDGWGPPIVAPTRLLHHGDVIELGNRTVTAVSTPGHTPGSTSFLDTTIRMLFTGDTVMRGDMHVDLEGGDGAAFTRSLEFLRSLDGYDAVCPAHFATPLPRSFVDQVAAHRLAPMGLGSDRADFDVVGAEYTD